VLDSVAPKRFEHPTRQHFRGRIFSGEIAVTNDKKKKTPAKAAPAHIAKKASSPKRKTVVRNIQPTKSLALRLLEDLPPLGSVHKAAFASSFSDAQCDAWGTRTKASNVLAEANRWVSIAATTLKKQPVLGYSKARLAWLCQLLLQLEDAVLAQQNSNGDHARTARSAAVAVADKCRRELTTLLYAVAGGRADLRQQVAERNENSPTPHVLASTLTGLVQLAMDFRRYPLLEVLCDDAGLDETLLSRTFAAAEALSAANEKTFTAARDVDAAETNRIEGRVLREMKVMMTQFEAAKTLGQAVPVLTPGAAVRHVLARVRGDGEQQPSPGATAPADVPIESIDPLIDTGKHSTLAPHSA
jgi:hypothetical protein